MLLVVVLVLTHTRASGILSVENRKYSMQTIYHWNHESPIEKENT
jgi:hypothetical protein